MDDLVGWLRAQLDDDERVARAAGGPNWRIVLIPDVSGPATTLELGGHDDRVILAGFADDDPLKPAEAEHIARWDSARVLAEVDAKRRILDLVLPGRYEGGYGEAYVHVVHELAAPYADTTAAPDK